ncbi:MAG: hypothetical protein L0Y58_15825 [Verrucomicrobia subdivision 3 bacterium]|nr:hypothetical protein [Limisphaerales bacterium]
MPTDDHNALINTPAVVAINVTENHEAEGMTISGGSSVGMALGGKIVQIEKQLFIGTAPGDSSGLSLSNGEIAVLGLTLEPMIPEVIVNGFVNINDDDPTVETELNADSMAIGVAGPGVVSINDGAKMHADKNLGIGYMGMGTVNVLAGGILVSNMTTVVGGHNRADPFAAPDVLFDNPSAEGTLFVSGQNAEAQLGILFVGGNNGATGHVTVGGQGVGKADVVAIAWGYGSEGQINVGVGSVFESTNDLEVAIRGNGGIGTSGIVKVSTNAYIGRGILGGVDPATGLPLPAANGTLEISGGGKFEAVNVGLLHFLKT